MIRSIAISLAAALVLVVGCDDKTPTPTKPADSTAPATPAMKEWKVGAYLSLSGEDSAFGIDTKEGIELAIDEVNKDGGPKGKPIKVLYEDDKSKPDEATNKVIQLIDRDKVVALLGEVASGRSKPGGIAANKRHVPMITPSSTNVDITKIGPFIFRVCFTDDLQGKLGAKFVVEQLQKKKIGVMYAADDPYSSGLEEEFEKEAVKEGATIAGKKGFPKKETNFTTYINELKSAGVEVIYAPVYYNQMTTIARQAKAAGVPGSTFVGGDGWDGDELLKDAGTEMEGAYFTNHYAPDVPWENSRKFVEKYKTRFNRDPASNAAQGYDAARLLADAIGRSKGDTAEAIRDAIADTKNFQGATGTITINAERNADKPIVIVQIKNKKFTYYSTASAGQGATPIASGAPAAGSASASPAVPSAAPSASAAPKK